MDHEFIKIAERRDLHRDAGTGKAVRNFFDDVIGGLRIGTGGGEVCERVQHHDFTVDFAGVPFDVFDAFGNGVAERFLVSGFHMDQRDHGIAAGNRCGIVFRCIDVLFKGLESVIMCMQK